jgi:hypothetical protein
MWVSRRSCRTKSTTGVPATLRGHTPLALVVRNAAGGSPRALLARSSAGYGCARGLEGCARATPPHDATAGEDPSACRGPIRFPTHAGSPVRAGRAEQHLPSMWAPAEGLRHRTSPKIVRAFFFEGDVPGHPSAAGPRGTTAPRPACNRGLRRPVASRCPRCLLSATGAVWAASEATLPGRSCDGSGQCGTPIQVQSPPARSVGR